MVAETAVYGAVGTSVGLAKDIYRLIKDLVTYEKSLEALMFQFEYYQKQFDVMTTTFNEIHEDLSADFQTSIISICQHLNEKLHDTQKDLQGSKRYKWSFVKSSITSAITALLQWIIIFQAHYAMLPSDLRKGFQDKMVSDAYKARNGEPLALLIKHIEDMSTAESGPENNLERKTAEPAACNRHFEDIIKVPSHIEHDPAELKKFELEVARLATVLMAANPTLTHLPKAVSWFELKYPGAQTPHAFGVAYETPDSIVKHHSLKSVIRAGPATHSLTDRMKVALDFVSAMAYVRGLGWVHKEIRTSNIRLDYKNGEWPSQQLGQVNLVGFCIARRGTGEAKSTDVSEDNKRFWENQVYCHPDRQTINIMADDIAYRTAQEEKHKSSSLSPVVPKPNSTYVIGRPAPASTPASTRHSLPYYQYKHDVYSIGVVLLEIGLWEDLTPKGKDNELSAELKANTALREFKPEQRKEYLLRKAQTQLPKVVGKKYAAIVKSCLEADDDGPGVSDVLQKLARIQL